MRSTPDSGSDRFDGLGTIEGDCDRGSGTLLMLAVVMLSGFLVLLTTVLANALVARHRAEAAADLAALAAASKLSPSEGCAQAERVARANHGRLQQCGRLADGSVLVGVELRGHGGHLLGTVRAVARAGVGAGASESGSRRFESR
jgi:secretion/DNA translocation related TadE-like protein